MKLYGLYKQATEGNVEGVMPRPMGYTVEDEGAKRKWDAWKREEGYLKTEAKRQYISYLIDTMRMYASGTHEARELLSELEFVWDQIKDLPYNPDEETHIPIPSHLPLFSQLDRFTNTTTPVPNPQYRDNLNRIYSHSRRSTAFSVNEYNARLGGHEDPADTGVPKTSGPLSVFSLPQMEDVTAGFGYGGGGGRGPTPGGRKSFTSASHGHTAALAAGLGHGGTAPVNAAANAAAAVSSGVTGAIPASVEEFKAWQAEINLAINKLMREITQRSSSTRNKHQLEQSDRHGPNSNGEDISKLKIQLKKRLLSIGRILGWNLLKIVQNFFFSVVALLFIAWCLKRNVVVNRTIVKLPGDLISTRQKKELVINLILETSENKWFIRLLGFINKVVGFV